MSKFWTVFFFHLKETVMAKSSLIVSVVLLVGSLGFFGITHFISEMDGDDLKVVVLSESQQYQVTEAEVADLVEGVTFTIHDVSELDAMKEQLEQDELDEVLVISDGEIAPVITSYFRGMGDPLAVNALTVFLQQKHVSLAMTEHDVAPEIVAEILTPVQVIHQPLDDAMANFGISYIFGFLLYIFLLTYGGSIAGSVVSEKSSRVMEVMISKVKPLTMLFAKVIAVFCSALVQLIVLAAGFGIANMIGWADLENFAFFGGAIDISSLTWQIIVAFILFFTLGYLLYGMMFAMVGSMVSRVEDLQSVSFPITGLVLIAFFIMMASLTDPNSTLAVVSTYISFFAPMVTFSRLVAGEVTGLEFSLSVSILIFTTVAIVFVTSRIYVNGVMHYGEKLKWKELGKFLKKS